MTSTTRRALGVGVLLAVIAVVLVANNFRSDARTTVELPPIGQVSADALEGSPAFVVHREDDTIYVLDAVGPHASFPEGSRLV